MARHVRSALVLLLFGHCGLLWVPPARKRPAPRVALRQGPPTVGAPLLGPDGRALRALPLRLQMSEDRLKERVASYVKVLKTEMSPLLERQKIEGLTRFLHNFVKQKSRKKLLPLHPMLGLALRSMLPSASPETLAITSLALCYAGVREGSAWQELAKSVASGPQGFNPRALAELAWSFSEVRYAHQGVFQTLLRKMEEVKQMANEQEKSVFCWASGNLGFNCSAIFGPPADSVDPQLSRKLFQRLDQLATNGGIQILAKDPFLRGAWRCARACVAVAMAEQRAADDLYRKTLRFLVSVAAELAYPKLQLRGGHTLGNGFLYELEGGADSEEEVDQIRKKLLELVDSEETIYRVTKPWKKAVSYFQEHNLTAASSLLSSRVKTEVQCYECHGVLRLNLFELHENASALKAGTFALVRCKEMTGFVASYTEDYQLQSALLISHTDHKNFCKGYQVRSVGELNHLSQVGRGRKDFVLACEFRQETKIAEIVAQVKERSAAGKAVKVICIAGPTSSGKTTFATKLCMYLQNNGYAAKPLTVDHYYLPLPRQPKYQARQQRSDVDYDHIESMDVELICEHLNALIAGKSVMTPVYNMKTGYRDGDGHKFDALPPNGILVIEGIHALNPMYTQAVDVNKVFKIFISPLTAMQLDDHNCVKTTDHRLLRRMCRDYLFRGNSAARTLGMWDNVRKGEGVWIFPHQNGADFVMNSAAEYEIPVLKTFIEPLLRGVPADDETYAKAQDVLNLLECFSTWPPEHTPGQALLREFIGDGVFDCH